MLFNLISSGNVRDAIISFLLSVPIIILVLSAHEYAHGYVANKLGDPTAESLGRLTLNPLKHIDPIGFLMFLLAGVGYARPVPINSRYFKKPRRDMALVGAAGPLTNFVMAIIFVGLLKLASLLYGVLPDATPTIVFETKIYVCTIFNLGVNYNLMFAFFNLIPIPPLDGSRVLYAFLPSKALFWMQRREKYFFWGLLGIILICNIFKISIIGIPVNLVRILLYMIFQIPLDYYIY